MCQVSLPVRWMLLAALLALPLVQAHDLSLTHSSILIDEGLYDQNRVIVDYTVPLNVLEARYPDGYDAKVFDAYFVERFVLTNDESFCSAQQVSEDVVETSLSVSYEYTCLSKLQNLTFTYTLWEEEFPSHENVVDIRIWNNTVQYVIIPTDWVRLDIPTIRHLADLEPAASAGDAPRAAGSWWNFFLLGIKHILLGYDHILFLLGLLLVAMHIKYLVQIVTAFTIAHSITLGLAIFDLIQINATLVEATIAFSIAYIAFENLWIKFVHSKKKTVAKAHSHYFANPKNRWLVAGIFGLVHGLGFSSVLKQVGIPDGQIIATLFSFNLGVEAGQLLIVSWIFPYIWLSREKKWHDRTVKALSIAIGIVGLFWLVARII